MKRIVFAFVLCAALPLAAQTQPAPPAKPAATAPAPQISELFQVKLENLNLRAQMLQQQFNESQQMQQIRAQYVVLVDEIKKAYPGYQWDGHQLVKVPTAPAPMAPAKKAK